METETTTLEPGTEIPSPLEAAEVVATAETDAAAAPEEPAKPSEEAPRYLIDGEPVADEYALLDHPKLKPHLERQDRRTEERLRGTLEAQYSQDARAREATQMHNALMTELGRIKKAIPEGEDFGDSVERLEALVAPANEAYQENVRAEGRKAGASMMSSAFYGILADGLDRKSRDEFEDVVQKDASLQWQDVLKLRDRLLYVEKHKAEIQELKDTIERNKVDAREGKGPNLTPTGAGGGGIDTYEEAARRYNLPVGHPQKITHEAFKEQRARFGVK